MAGAVEPAKDADADPPCAGVAARLIDPAMAAGAEGLVYLAAGERRAEEIGHALRQMAPDVEVIVFPPWDCLAYDRASPSRASMGRRMAALARLTRAGEAPRIWISSPEAMLQRTPPPEVAAAAALELSVGSELERSTLHAFAARTGHLVHDPVDDAGEISTPAEVTDVFPADADAPVRLSFGAEGAIAEIRRFDPVSQRTAEAIPRVTLPSASEWVTADADAERRPGGEHDLARAYDRLELPLQALAERPWLSDPTAAPRCAEVWAQIQDAHAARVALGGADPNAPAAPGALYLGKAELEAMVARLKPLPGGAGPDAVPRLAGGRNPGGAFCATVQARLEEGRRVVVAGDARELRALGRALKRGCDRSAPAPAAWSEAVVRPPGELAAVELDVAAGFDDPGAGVYLIAAADVLGGHLSARGAKTNALADAAELALGDVVIHEDHGLGVLKALERVTLDEREQDAVRLAFHGDATLLVEIGAFGRLWRYGAEPDAVTLDRLNTDGWNRRRAAISQEVDRTAQRLVELARARETAEGVVLVPPRAAYARFAARFAFPETPDQAAAIAAVDEDLASGRQMDRLICGDVGFGKTEVALRAAAAAALCGRQVAVVAPTTVLARQHLSAFQRRFAGTGVEVAQLSRLTSAAEAKRVKAGLGDGSIRVVVGTHAVAAEGVAFASLALVIVDEEQRFGARIKQRLHDLAPTAHRLTLTATPIPRTLQLAMIGVQDVSVIATPPSRRRPIRTFVAPFDAATLRTALLREQRRGGQSFVVVPRIEDIAPFQARLADLALELRIVVAHGELPAEEVDAAMVGFGEGDGDVLLATSIIESGLDVPRANTMIVWRPDRFGLAQLHQLRGRVGRGRAQGVAYLLTDGDAPLAEATAARLATLQAHERLGSGLAISARDLDLRGAGDLVGEDQAGHLQMIGADLYQELLTRAVRAAKGEPSLDDWTPELHLPIAASLPESFVPDATVRINLYARLARLHDLEAVRAFGEELEDRFGPLPDAAAALVGVARLRTLARRAGVARLDAGPRAVGFRFRDPAAARALSIPDGAAWKAERLVWTATFDAPATQAAAIEAQLDRWSSTET